MNKRSGDKTLAVIILILVLVSFMSVYYLYSWNKQIYYGVMLNENEITDLAGLLRVTSGELMCNDIECKETFEKEYLDILTTSSDNTITAYINYLSSLIENETKEVK